MTRIKIKNHWIKQTDKHTHTYTQRNKDDNLNKRKANKKKMGGQTNIKKYPITATKYQNKILMDELSYKDMI